VAVDGGTRKEGGLRTRGVEKGSAPERPLISVITVVFNGALHLEQTIQSVLDQGYEKIEYIIIDGGSTDGTLDIIRRFDERIDYWRSEPDNGIYDAMNKGIDLAGGELIALLNADDFYEPAAVAAVVGQYLKDPVPQLLYGNTFFINERLNLRYRSYAHSKYWRGMCFSHQAMFVHRDIYRLLGPYDTTLRIAGDYDYVVRAATRGVRFTPVDAFLVNYRDSGVSARDQIASMGEGRMVLRRYIAPISREHIVFLLLLCKSILLLSILRIMKAACGEQCSAGASAWYLKNFIARDGEPLR